MTGLSFITSMLVLINPFARFVYLNPVIDEVGERLFLLHVFATATEQPTTNNRPQRTQ